MIRLLIFLAALALAAGGLTWLANNPGVVDLTWRGEEYEVSLMFALGAVLALAVVLAIVWGVLRFVFRVPSLVSVASRVRRRAKGFQALSRGMIAVGAGDARAAAKHASEANRLIGHEPLTKLLQAQSAQLSGDTAGAVAAYNAMLEMDQIDAPQQVLARDLLGAQMLLHRHRIIRAAFDGQVVAHDHALAARHPPDAGDNAGAGNLVVVHAAGGKR